MEPTMQVSKWGNSLAVRLPKALVDELGLKEGDEINVVAAKDGVIEVETKQEQRRRALERLASLNWTLPPDYKFDREEANER
jgi:antitoxin MazE